VLTDIRGAGTDANVKMQLFGEKGNTGNRKLESSANDFERGKVSSWPKICLRNGSSGV
jgi:hypothetical protein